MAVIDEAVATTLAAHPELAAQVRGRVPKAWSALAAQGVLALRERLGRVPSDEERRALWTVLWSAAHREEVL